MGSKDEFFKQYMKPKNDGKGPRFDPYNPFGSKMDPNRNDFKKPKFDDDDDDYFL
jgi:hypothetical protein